MAREQLPRHIQELLYADEHRLLNDRVGHAVRHMFRLGVAGEFEHSELRSRIERDRIRQAFAGPFRVPKLNKGDFIIGYDVHV